jgi:hypothetical protein
MFELVGWVVGGAIGAAATLRLKRRTVTSAVQTPFGRLDSQPGMMDRRRSGDTPVDRQTLLRNSMSRTPFEVNDF